MMCMVHVCMPVTVTWKIRKTKKGKVSTYGWNYVAIVNCYGIDPIVFFTWQRSFKHTAQLLETFVKCKNNAVELLAQYSS